MTCQIPALNPIGSSSSRTTLEHIPGAGTTSLGFANVVLDLDVVRLAASEPSPPCAT
jgi:hypothetical protein